jgi:hypothetical protein
MGALETATGGTLTLGTPLTGGVDRFAAGGTEALGEAALFAMTRIGAGGLYEGGVGTLKDVLVIPSRSSEAGRAMIVAALPSMAAALALAAAPAGSDPAVDPPPDFPGITVGLSRMGSPDAPDARAAPGTRDAALARTGDGGPSARRRSAA